MSLGFPQWRAQMKGSASPMPDSEAITGLRCAQRRLGKIREGFLEIGSEATSQASKQTNGRKATEVEDGVYLLYHTRCRASHVGTQHSVLRVERQELDCKLERRSCQFQIENEPKVIWCAHAVCLWSHFFSPH